MTENSFNTNLPQEPTRAPLVLEAAIKLINSDTTDS